MKQLIYTKPATPDQFVGRAHETAEFNKLMELFKSNSLAENTIVITGPPGIGKSSFLNFATQRNDVEFLRVNARGGDFSNLFLTSSPRDKKFLKIITSMREFYEVAVKVGLSMTPASPLTHLLDLIPSFSSSKQKDILEILKEENEKLEKERKKLVIALDQAETFFQKTTYCPQFLERIAKCVNELPSILLCICIQLRFNGHLWDYCPTIRDSHRTIEIPQLERPEEAAELLKKRLPHIDFEDEVIGLIYDYGEAIPLDIVWITDMLIEDEEEVDKKLWDASEDKISEKYQRLLKEANESTNGLAVKIYKFLNILEGDKFSSAKTIAHEIHESHTEVEESCTILEDRGLLLKSGDEFRIFRGEHFLKGKTKIVNKLIWDENESKIRARYQQAFLSVAENAGEVGTEILLAMTKLRDGAVGIYTSEIAEMTMCSKEEIEMVCSKLEEMKVLLREKNQYRINNDRFYDWLYEEKLNKEEKQIVAFRAYSRVFGIFKERKDFEGMSQILRLMIDEYEDLRMEIPLVESTIRKTTDESMKILHDFMKAAILKKSVNDFIRAVEFRVVQSFLEQFERAKAISWKDFENLLLDLFDIEFRARRYENASMLLNRLANLYRRLDSKQKLSKLANAYFHYGDYLRKSKEYGCASNFYEEASLLFEALENTKDFRSSLVSIRKCLELQLEGLFEQKHYYDCMRLLEKSIEISKKLKNDELVREYTFKLIESYLLQANIEMSSGRRDLSLSNFRKAYELSNEVNNGNYRAQALIGMGKLAEIDAEAAMKSGDVEKALKLFEDARRAYSYANDKDQEGRVTGEINRMRKIKEKTSEPQERISERRIPAQAHSNRTKVITIASGKGGTGKTTVTANLGTSLALFGKRTIILDADIAMANLALILGMEKSSVTIHEVLAGGADIKDAMYKGPSGVIVVPCGMSLSGFQKSKPERLQDVMIELLEGTEFLLIDAPAGLSLDGVIPLAVADEVILVVNPEISSMADALKTKIMTEMVGSRVSGVILNRANFEKTDLSMREVEKILGVKILEVIPEDPEVRRSAAFKTPIVIRSEDSPAAIGYRRLASKMVGQRFAEPEMEREEGVVSRFVRLMFERRNGKEKESEKGG